MEDVAVKISASRYHFGIYLDFEVGKLDAIEQNHRHSQRRCFAAVYSTWKAENPKPLTWETVVEILRKDLMGQKALSLSLAEKCNVQI